MQCARVDYVRYRLSFDAGLSSTQALELEDLCQDIKAQNDIPGKPYGISDYFDKALRTRVRFFNAWGELAEHLHFRLGEEWMWALMRIDVRHPLDAEKMDFPGIYTIAEAKAGNRYTVHRFRSPYKQKRQGRDSGGSGVTIGGQGAARRVSLYQRSSEGPAWEFQFSGKPLYAMLARLRRDGVSDGRSWQSNLTRMVAEDGYKYSAARLGGAPADLERGIVSSVALLDYTDPEAILTQMDIFWDILPNQAQEAFLESKATISEADAVRIVHASAMLEEADWQEDEFREPIEPDLPFHVSEWVEPTEWPAPPDICDDGVSL
jgi:hypothetical protein